MFIEMAQRINDHIPTLLGLLFRHLLLGLLLGLRLHAGSLGRWRRPLGFGLGVAMLESCSLLRNRIILRFDGGWHLVSRGALEDPRALPCTAQEAQGIMLSGGSGMALS